jgi:hypothetical protein|tara:strand:+ start:252 stop:557 length:306 start_codon:yes stop_codon:yes gene_type:complete
MKYNKLYENWNRHLEENWDPETGEAIDDRTPEQKAADQAQQAHYNALSPEEKAEFNKTRMADAPAGDTRMQGTPSADNQKLKVVAQELKVLLSKIMKELGA